MSEPLTVAFARAASRFVGESKVGNRKGSVAAVARAMTARGVEISNNTLSRKLDGLYPMSTEEIGALAGVLGVDPDVIWQDALRIMRETPPTDHAATDELESGLSPAARRNVEKGRAAVRDSADPQARARADVDDGISRTAEPLLRSA